MATSEQEAKGHGRLPKSVVNAAPATVEAPSDLIKENIPDPHHLDGAAETMIDEDEQDCEPGGSPAFGSPAQIPQTDLEDAVTEEFEDEGSPFLRETLAQIPETRLEDAATSECEHQQSPPLGSPAQTPRTGNEDAIVDECEHERSTPPGSAAQTPQTGNEDGADEHSSITAGKQSSPGIVHVLNCDGVGSLILFFFLCYHRRGHVGRWGGC